MASRYSAEILAVITGTVVSDNGLTLPTAPLRFALFGGVYPDTVNPGNPDLHYAGRIKSDVILDKKIGVVFWNEDSDIDFGYLDIANEDQNQEIIDFATAVSVAQIDLYRVNVSDPSMSTLNLLATAQSSDIAFVDEDTVRFRLESLLQGAFESRINEFFYDNTYPQLEGKPYPIAWGPSGKTEQLLPTIFVDATSLRYDVTDLDIVAAGGSNAHPYDRGIALDTEGTAGEFIIIDNGFELQQNPDGKITWGNTVGNDWLEDPFETGASLLGLFRITRLAMERAGVWDSVVEDELTSLEAGYSDMFPFYHTLDVTPAEEFLTTVLSGIGGWYYVDELSQIHFGKLTKPEAQSPVLNFTDSNVIGDIEVEDDRAPCLSTRISYGANPGAYNPDELAGGVSNADKVKMANVDYVVQTTQTVLEYYDDARQRDPIHFASAYHGTARADALAELNRWWADLYPKRRRFFTFSVQINDPIFDDVIFQQWTADSITITADSIVHTADGSSGAAGTSSLPQPGDFCSLQSDTFGLLETALNLLIRRVRYDFSKGMITIEGWG